MKTKALEIAMRCDEQGSYPVQYVGHLGPFLKKGRDAGITCVITGNLWHWSRVFNDKRIRFVADKDDHVFIWSGPAPIVRHPFIAKLLREEEHCLYKDYSGGQNVRHAITECRLEGDKVVNITSNTQWGGPTAPFEYRWGPLPGKRLDYKAYEDEMMKHMASETVPERLATNWGEYM